jgi:hypothetical protein
MSRDLIQKGAKLSDKEHSECFKQTARELSVDESGESFERAFGKIIQPPKGAKQASA